MPTDYFGETLKVDDEVVFMEISYRNLTRGIITKINPKKATITWKNYHGWQGKTTQFYSQLIKVPADKCKLSISDDGELLTILAF